ncbi:MAG: hypothetical protein ACKO96_07115, partial [Flammeovirgaceae bacterium]
AKSDILAQICEALQIPAPCDCDNGQAAIVLSEIISENHTLDDFIYPVEENETDNRQALQDFIDDFDLSDGDQTIEFDGNEYRIIRDSDIWDIYRDEIENIVNDCYDLKLDKIPSFIAVSIDWEQTAKNAYIDGYGHTFSSYDHSEIETDNGFWVFRTN